MAETIREMIVPGTYIEVRAEGLLSIGAISTGNIGLIGTAEKGAGATEILSSFEDGRARFGDLGEWDPNDPTGAQSNLTLVRALKILFDNGASTVYARRVYNAAVAKPATYRLQDESGNPLLELRAKTPGKWGNRLQIRIEPAETRLLVPDERAMRTNGTVLLSAQKVVEPEPAEASIGSVTVFDEGLAKKYQLKKSSASSETVQIDPGSRRLTFNTMPSGSAQILASYWVPQDGLRQVTLRYGNTQEVFTVPSVGYLAQRLQDENNPSQLVEVVELEGDPRPLNNLPKATTGFIPFSQGENGSVDPSHFQEALDDLAEQNVQIVVVAGLNFSQAKAAVLGHVEKTENMGRERIAVLGADSSLVDKITENANDVADKRVILAAPGIRQVNPQTNQPVSLPPYFTAAAVAGKLSSVAPNISLTNKTIAGIDRLETEYNYGQLASLIQNRVLTLQTKRGIRVVKGITTDDGAFKQISIRRIVDYIKEGTRIGCNQYIGRLNNRRVRGNLETTLKGFLDDLLLREFLTSYKLTVFADRPMEIRGEVLVTMDLQPTFSIDYIRVTMNLS